VLLGLWTLASATWAADKFMAAVSGFNWLSAMTLAWATAQLVRTSSRARLVAGVGVGLLLIYIVHTITYLTIDLPALRETVEKTRDQLISQRGWTPDSFEARRFLQKVMAGELVGFSASPNTFAAYVVATMVFASGLALQRLREGGGGRAWAAVIGAASIGGAIVVYLTDSRTALATVVLAAVLFVVVGALGSLMRRYARWMFVLGSIGVAGVTAIVLWRGISTGTLFHDSLTFRWRYWVGAWRVFREHPLAGVGWENFGPYYLARRLAIAAEEPRDPHNFVVRFCTELGLVGGLLAVAAFILVLWRITRPGDDVPNLLSATAQAEDSDASLLLLPQLAVPLTIGTAAMALNVFATIDWTQHFDYIDLELRKRLLYTVLLSLGVFAATVRASAVSQGDASWLRGAFVIATLLLLLQNLVDFSMFEPGGMVLLALMVGSAVGLSPATGEAMPVPRRWPRWALVGMAVAWLAAVFGLVVPIGLAESEAARGDDMRQKGRSGAADLYAAAFDRVSYNADYAYSVARSLLEERRPLADFRRWIDITTATNPMSVKPLLLSARVEAAQQPPNMERMRTAYDRALQIDPQNHVIELEYGQTLAKLDLSKDAAEHFRRALEVNAAFDREEPKRLRRERVAEIEAILESLNH
jgi:tetratricopeptide (TPR) repeat protein